MPKKEKEKEESFYVGIKDPIEMRRSILESSKELVEYMQRSERFKSIRAEKTEHIEKLKSTIKELKKLVKKAKVALPKTKLRTMLHEREKRLKMEQSAKEKAELKKTKIKAAVKEEKKIVEKVEEKKEMTELEKLESELSEIEGRLSRLN